MDFTLKRIGKILAELKTYITREELPVEHFKYKEGYFRTIAQVEASPAVWQEFPSGGRWGGRDVHCWFRTDVRIPERFAGQIVALRVSTGLTENSWDAINPQFILYINGELIQGLDVNHREVIFTRRAEAGTVYRFDLQAYGGMLDRKVELRASLALIDETVKNLYYDLNVPLLIAKELPPEDRRREILLSTLNETINRLDLRKPYSAEFYSSIVTAGAFLAEQLKEKHSGAEEVIATCVGHTHIDVAWLWPLAQTREKAARSFATVLKLMEDYPEYIFMSSQPQLYQFVKEDYPGLYAKIKDRIKEGRWEPEGAMWVEADCNLASGEALVRQIMFGTRFFKTEFGVTSRVLWLPDVFGYSAALPQILRKSGIDYFMTTKISWNETNRIPYDTFMWRGIDGTEVLTHFITTTDPDSTLNPHFTTYNGKLIPSALMGGWQRYQQKHLNNDILIAFGYGDGGGGPTPEMLENARRLNKGLTACPRVKMGKVADFFRRLEAKVAGRKDLPKWVGELYLEYHRGTYTSMARNKRYNRKSELLYQDAEFFGVFGMELGMNYPQQAINKGWEIILLNQFHDILPGSSIKEVYEESRAQYQQILADGRRLIEASLSAITARINLEEPSIVVFNTLSFDRDELAALTLPAAVDCRSLLEDSGRKIPVQTITEEGEKKVIFLAQQVPAKGYRTYTLSIEAPEETAAELQISSTLLENRFFRITIDERGTFSSIYDKLNRRELLPPGERGNQLQAFEDKPAEFDNWNIDAYFKEKMWEIDTVEEVTVLETGPVRGGIRIRKKFLDSTIMQKIYIYRDLPRIDFDTYINWRENQILLKAAFPLDIHADRATYEIQFGNVERTTHQNTSWDRAQFEVPAHKWADLSEAGFGVSLLNDCKYGYDIKDGVMRLTLLKSGNEPNPEADREEHRFVYSLYPHAGDWRNGKTVQMAYSLNVPLYPIFETPHPGELPAKRSLFRLDQDNVVMETVKKAEDDDGIILRLYETENRRCLVRLTADRKFQTVTECNLMEVESAAIPFTGSSFSFEIKPYEIKTFKITFAE